MLLPAKQSTLKLLPPHFGPGWGSFTWWVWHKKHVQWVMDVMDMALDQTCMKHQSSVDHWKILNISKKFFWPKPYRHTAPISSTAPCLMARSHSSIVTSQRFGSKFRAAEKRRMATSTATIDSSWDLQYSDTKILLGSFHWNVWYVFWIFKCNIYIYITLSHIISLYESHFIHHEWGVHMKQPHQSPRTIDVQPAVQLLVLKLRWPQWPPWPRLRWSTRLGSQDTDESFTGLVCWGKS
jgi:hypothetical protein